MSRGKCHPKGWFAQLFPGEFLCQLDAPSKRDPPLKNCLYQLGLWAWQGGIFWINIWHTRTKPTVGSAILRWTWAIREVANMSPGASVCPVFLCGLFQFLPGSCLPWWWTITCKPNKASLPPLLLGSVFQLQGSGAESPCDSPTWWEETGNASDWAASQHQHNPCYEQITVEASSSLQMSHPNRNSLRVTFTLKFSFGNRLHEVLLFVFQTECHCGIQTGLEVQLVVPPHTPSLLRV